MRVQPSEAPRADAARGASPSAGLPPVPTRGLQERIEGSAAGQFAISVLVTFLVGALVAWNLPESALRTALTDRLRPAMYAVGLTQSWSMFAPDPPQTSVAFAAEATGADGTTVVWRPPEGRTWPLGLRAERWRKWWTDIASERGRDQWPDAARVIAERLRAEGHDPVTVTLVRRWRDTPPPGETSTVPWQSRELYTLDLRTGTGREP